MHILIAPNAFKNSLDAAGAAAAIRRGLLHSNLTCTCECFPIGDGGDGTASLLVRKCRGIMVPAEVHDPLGRKIHTRFGLIDGGKTAVVEMADASGLRWLRRDEYDPLQAHTFGTGELLKYALNHRVNKIILGVGGTATVDGATGILRALGVRFRDAYGRILSRLPEELVALESIDLSGLDGRTSDCTLTVLCDVENTLLGKQGAANVFGPQKGATGPVVEKLEAALTKFRRVTLRQTGRDLATIKRGGAAGGAAAGLKVFLVAKLVDGIRYFLDRTGFDDALHRADLVITGEGRMDEQTLLGKGPFGVTLRANKRKVPVVGMAGGIEPRVAARLRKHFVELLVIGKADPKLEKALKQTGADLQRTATELGNRLAAKA